MNYGVRKTVNPAFILSNFYPLLFPPYTFGDIYVPFSSTKTALSHERKYTGVNVHAQDYQVLKFLFMHAQMHMDSFPGAMVRIQE